MNYPGFTNEEIAKLVSYAIATDCEKGRRRFEEEFEKEAPPSRTVRAWKARFIETLSVLPKPKGRHEQKK